MYQFLNNLRIRKGAGPDGFPAIFVKKYAHCLSCLLTIIFNDSIRTGHFLNKWNNLFVIPTFKS